MAIKFAQTQDGNDDSRRFQPMERLVVYLFGTTVLFAALGMGEAVYRLLFSEFDGATDRLPIEASFGLVFAWLATKFVSNVYRNRKERSARLSCSAPLASGLEIVRTTFCSPPARLRDSCCLS